MQRLNRREFVGSTAIIAVGAMLCGASPEGVMKTIEFPDRLDLFNPVAVKYYAMFLKESSPIALKGSDCDRNPPVFEHTTMCGIRDAFALTGILVESDPDAKISVMLDGEYILKAAPPAVVSAFIPRSGSESLTSLFAAKTPENIHAGLFLPNGTNIWVFVSEPRSPRVTVTLRMALYTFKAPAIP